MIQQRNLGLAIILTLVTCGLYSIYWMIVMTNEVGELSGDSSFTGGKHFLLSLVTFGIWSLVWSYQIGKLVGEAQKQRGIPPTDNSVLYLVLTLLGLGIVTFALVQSDVNKMV